MMLVGYCSTLDRQARAAYGSHGGSDEQHDAPMWGVAGVDEDELR